MTESQRAANTLQHALLSITQAYIVGRRKRNGKWTGKSAFLNQDMPQTRQGGRQTDMQVRKT